MGRSADKTTSLWAVIEGMQQRLEALGLESEVVDAAVATGLRRLLEDTPSPEPEPESESRRAFRLCFARA